MCGISGVFHFDSGRVVDPHLVRRMRAVMTHRGPDDEGEFFSGNLGLGFNRLSIIDIVGGNQPMWNEDRSVCVVFNGEIYNFQEIRQDLQTRGHNFRTRSDTEVIVHAWEEFSEACVERFRGMFAFVVWDTRHRVLFGARDRLGIKPFYYHASSHTFAFASEIKALLQLPEIKREIDPSSLAEYLHHRYVIAPHTMLRDITKLPPAHFIKIKHGKVTIRRYWEAPLETDSSRRADKNLEELGDLLKQVVKLHLISDVPLGTFLSGGLDSSALVATMAQFGTPDIKTFSIGYDTPDSELDYARVVARCFHTDHHELRLTAAAFRDSLPTMIWHMDEPLGDEASIPLYHLAAFARRKVAVVLSGEGSDELFGGYPMYRTMLAYELVNRLPLASPVGGLLARISCEGKLRKYASMIGQPIEMRYGGVSRLFSKDQLSRFLLVASSSHNGAAAAYQRCKKAPLLSRMSFVDLTTWLADDLLTKADKMTMANSLELRVPFLDHKLVEFALRLPAELKVRGNTGKYLLKRYMERFLPGQIVHRSKKGFPVPIRTWLTRELAGFARETLLASNSASRQWFDASQLTELLDTHRRRDCSGQIYALLVFEQWHRSFVFKEQASSPR